jgi:hypothetical protein
VTPQLAAHADLLQGLGYASDADRWLLPPSAFNLDWKER